MSRIALVDDDRNILTSVSMTLEAEGFEVETYNDGQQAFDAFSKRLPDMAVLDIKMPRMDGLEVLRWIRGRADLRGLPVVMLTSSREEQDIVESYQLGVNAYVVKPVEFEEFMQAVRTLGLFWAILNEPGPGVGRLSEPRRGAA